MIAAHKHAVCSYRKWNQRCACEYGCEWAMLSRSQGLVAQMDDNDDCLGQWVLVLCKQACNEKFLYNKHLWQ